MSEIIWHNGFPKIDGIYKCILDNELVINLKCCTCPITRKPRWVDMYNADVMDYDVKWSDNIT